MQYSNAYVQSRLCVAVCCSVLQCVAGRKARRRKQDVESSIDFNNQIRVHRVMQCIAVSCSVLQCVAVFFVVCWNVLQCVAVCCSVV